MKRKTIDLKKVIDLHDRIIEEYGGLKGIISLHTLEAALNRPFSGLSDGREFFPTLIDKAAALLEGLIRFHPFVDGNKRTAAVLAKLSLEENDLNWDFSNQEIVDFVIQIAEGKLSFAEIALWIGERIKET